MPFAHNVVPLLVIWTVLSAGTVLYFTTWAPTEEDYFLSKTGFYRHALHVISAMTFLGLVFSGAWIMGVLILALNIFIVVPTTTP